MINVRKKIQELKDRVTEDTLDRLLRQAGMNMIKKAMQERMEARNEQSSRQLVQN